QPATARAGRTTGRLGRSHGARRGTDRPVFGALVPGVADAVDQTAHRTDLPVHWCVGGPDAFAAAAVVLARPAPRPPASTLLRVSGVPGRARGVRPARAAGGCDYDLAHRSHSLARLGDGAAVYRGRVDPGGRN